MRNFSGIQDNHGNPIEYLTIEQFIEFFTNTKSVFLKGISSIILTKIKNVLAYVDTLPIEAYDIANQNIEMCDASHKELSETYSKIISHFLNTPELETIRDIMENIITLRTFGEYFDLQVVEKKTKHEEEE